MLWLEGEKNRRLLAFASEQESCEVEVRSDTPLGDITDAELEALLDRTMRPH